MTDTSMDASDVPVDIADDKKAEKDVKAAAKKAEKEAKKLKALEKAKKQEEEKAAKAAAGGGNKAQAKADAKAKAETDTAEAERLIAAAAATPSGERKNTSQEAPKGYHPRCVSFALVLVRLSRFLFSRSHGTLRCHLLVARLTHAQGAWLELETSCHH